MRLAGKREIHNFIKNLHQVHTNIRENMRKHDHVAAQELLAKCQDYAIELGTTLEAAEAESCVTVSYVEEYCEAIYCVFENIDDFSDNKAYKMLKKHLLRIENSVRYDIACRKEIVFMPYKASMWDSLESVYLAAKEDMRCDVYCVPIPYYGRGADGESMEMHYEGYDFPEYVQITHYEDYLLEERRPDIIYIHNPYDGGNKVTSVHPRFYSTELQKYTECLIYIPYFIMGDIIHPVFAVNAATIHADKVVLQSQKEADVFTREFVRSAVEEGISETQVTQILQNKWLILGSPKIDKVINSSREDFVIPQKWKEIIGGRKAVFYNTSISGILAGKRQELEKIKDTISFFKGNQDFVLWWRPHPLSAGAILSMRSGLWEEYQQIIQEFEQNEWGIYDTTADLHRAIAWTDLYYGDDSSVVHLYGITGKPIVLQSMLVRLLEERKDIRITDCAWENKRLWFTAQEYNGLYEWDAAQRRTVFVGKVPDENDFDDWLYSRMIKTADAIWMIPCKAVAIAKYELASGSFTRIALPESLQLRGYKFFAASMWKNCLYMFPWRGDCVIVYDTDNNSFRKEQLNDLVLQGQYRFEQDEPVFYNSDCIVDNKIYLCINNRNLVAEYSFEEHRMKLFQIGNSTKTYSGIAFDGKDFWLISQRYKGVIKWNKDAGTLTEYDALPDGCVLPRYWESICYANGFLWLLPYQGNMLVRVNPATGGMESVFTSKDRFFSGTRSVLKKMNDEEVIAGISYSDGNSMLMVIGKGGRPTDTFTPAYQQEDMEKLSCSGLRGEKYSSILADDFVIRENHIYNLRHVLNEFQPETAVSEKQKEKYCSLFVNSDGNAGKIINKCINELVAE